MALFFPSRFTVTTRKRILNLYVFVFLETQETGATPKWQRGLQGAVSMMEISHSQESNRGSGWHLFHAGQEWPPIGRTREAWLRPQQGGCLAEVPLPPCGPAANLVPHPVYVFAFLNRAYSIHAHSCVFVECLVASCYFTLPPHPKLWLHSPPAPRKQISLWW